MNAPTTWTSPEHRKSVLWVVTLAAIAIVFDGYDLVVYGAVLPTLMADPTQIGALGAVRLNGLALGLVLMVGHMARERNWQGSLRQLCASRLWLAGPYSSAVFSNASANNSRK